MPPKSYFDELSKLQQITQIFLLFKFSYFTLWWDFKRCFKMIMNQKVLLVFKCCDRWNAVTILSAGTPVTSCDSCHGKATCLESQERGDTFTGHALSCICKDGFVGDGLTCYDPKLCSDSSCCDRGYHWSSEKGCVDTDECSLPNSPCTPPQICHNTPGSYECPEPSSKNRAAASSQSVRFYCGNTVCPSGTDCINSQCVDPCQNYATLNDDWRSTNNTNTEVLHCDQYINWQGWYRLFLNQTSARIPERCVESNRCGTDAPLWITQPHPTWSGEIVNRTVCNDWSGSCCHFQSHTIHVKLCHANYYVYKLVKPYTCNLAYCAGKPML